MFIHIQSYTVQEDTRHFYFSLGWRLLFIKILNATNLTVREINKTRYKKILFQSNIQIFFYIYLYKIKSSESLIENGFVTHEET